MFKRFISKLEAMPVSFSQWVAMTFCAVMVRVLLERFSSPPTAGVILFERIIHHSFSFITIGLLIGLGMVLFLPQKRKALFKLIMFGLPVIWLAPLLDVLTSGGMSRTMDYLITDLPQLLHNYVVFWGASEIARGATLGVRIEITLLLLFIFFYAKQQNAGWIKSLGAVVVSYTFIFIYGAMPNFLVFAEKLFSSNIGHLTPKGIFMSLFTRPSLSAQNMSFIASPLHYHQTLHGSMAAVFYILTFVLAGAWFYLLAKDKFFAVLKNSRPERLLHILLVFTAGAVLANQMFPHAYQFFWLDAVYLTALALAFYSACMFAIGANDLEDIAIDRVANPNRPLPKGSLIQSDYQNLNLFFLISAFSGSYVLGVYPFMAVLVFTAAYYIYSASPLRLKQVAGLSSFLIAVACLAVFVGGFFVWSPDKRFTALPLTWMFLILTVFTLGANIRDIKDFQGDKEAGVWTLPVLLGLERSKRLIGILLACAFLSVPLFLGNSALWWTSVPFAVGGYLLVNQKVYREWPIFILYYAYPAAAFLTTFKF